jgi:hypothetical protein
VRESEKVERLGLRKPAVLSVPDGEPPELDQPRLLIRQLQAEVREPLAKIREEPLGVVTMLEAHHEVVRVAHDDHLAARLPTPPLVDP